MVNKVILIGNVGSDPEIRNLENGVKMARIRVATTERFFSSSSGEKQEHTEWHSVTLWRSQADFAERYIQKGTLIYVEGKIRSREIPDPVTKIFKTVFEIHANDIKTLNRRAAFSNNKDQTLEESIFDDQSEQVPNPDGLPF